jgi:hypothetical protein
VQTELREADRVPSVWCAARQGAITRDRQIRRSVTDMERGHTVAGRHSHLAARSTAPLHFL